MEAAAQALARRIDVRVDALSGDGGGPGVPGRLAAWKARVPAPRIVSTSLGVF